MIGNVQRAARRGLATEDTEAAGRRHRELPFRDTGFNCVQAIRHRLKTRVTKKAFRVCVLFVTSVANFFGGRRGAKHLGSRETLRWAQSKTWRTSERDTGGPSVPLRWRMGGAPMPFHILTA